MLAKGADKSQYLVAVLPFPGCVIWVHYLTPELRFSNLKNRGDDRDLTG